MRKTKLFWILVVLFMAFGLSSAQEPMDAVLTNSGVIDLVKANLSENIIVTKIKNSKCEFDTSSGGLVKLKESGVADAIITAMIEAGSKAVPSKPEIQKTADLKEAIGKRKVFLIADDEESRIEIIKKFKSKGFSFVEDKKEAELIFELSYSDGTTQSKAGILRGGNENQFKTKLGKFIVKLNKDSIEYLIYANEYDFARASSMASMFGMSATMPSLVSQVKYYFNDDFLKQLKKAGDRIK